MRELSTALRRLFFTATSSETSSLAYLPDVPGPLPVVRLTVVCGSSMMVWTRAPKTHEEPRSRSRTVFESSSTRHERFIVLGEHGGP